MRTISCLLSLFVTLSPSMGAAPIATSYVYRSDNYNPSPLLQFGAPDYPQPTVYLNNIVEPQNFITYPGTLVNHAALIDQAYDEENKAAEGATDHEDEHYTTQGHKDTTGYNSKNHHAKGSSGHYESCHNTDHDSEADGELTKLHDEQDAHGNHEETDKNFKGGEQGHKQYHDKGQEVTGYHKVFHKDEFKTDHDFYDVAKKRGGFKKHVNKIDESAIKHGDHNEGSHSEAGKESQESSEQGYHEKEKSDVAAASHSSDAGSSKHFTDHEDHNIEDSRVNERTTDESDDDYDDEDDED